MYCISVSAQACSLRLAAWGLLLEAYCWRLTAWGLLLEAYCWRLTAWGLLLEAYCLRLTVGGLLLEACCLRAYCLRLIHLFTCCVWQNLCNFCEHNLSGEQHPGIWSGHISNSSCAGRKPHAEKLPWVWILVLNYMEEINQLCKCLEIQQ